MHRPQDTRIFRKECRSLARAGYEVHLIGAGPTSTIDGVQGHSLARDDERPRARAQWARQARAALHAARLWPSVYHLHEAHLIPLGLLLKLGGAQVIYDAHEDYPAHARTKLHRHPFRAALKASMWRLLEALARRAFDRFVCASPSLAASFPDQKTVVVGNFPIQSEFEHQVDTRPYRERSNRVVITGWLSEYRCFWELMRAVELLPEALDARLRLIGGFRPARLEQVARKREAWRRIEFLGKQPFENVVRELHGARVGLAMLRPLPNHLDAPRSNKLFEYMAAGIPIVGPDFPAWREIVEGVGCGLLVDPCSPEQIAGAIEQLLTEPGAAEEMGQRGQRAIQERFTWSREEARLLSLYRSLADSAPALAADRAIEA